MRPKKAPKIIKRELTRLTFKAAIEKIIGKAKSPVPKNKNFPPGFIFLIPAKKFLILSGIIKEKTAPLSAKVLNILTICLVLYTAMMSYIESITSKIIT